MLYLCTVVYNTKINLIVVYFAVNINLGGPLIMIACQPSASMLSTSDNSIVSVPTALSDASVASTMKIAATFSDIIHVVVLSIVSVYNIFLIGLLIELIVRIKILICINNNF